MKDKAQAAQELNDLAQQVSLTADSLAQMTAGEYYDLLTQETVVEINATLQKFNDWGEKVINIIEDLKCEKH